MFSQKALEACFVLHKEMLTGDDFFGYEGTKDDFDNLYNEVYEIVRNELPDDCYIDQVVNCFYDYQAEIQTGDRDVCWYL